MSKHPAKKQPRTKAKQRPRAKREGRVKVVKAFALTYADGETIDLNDIHLCRENALLSQAEWARENIHIPIIPVLITPLPRSRK